MRWVSFQWLRLIASYAGSMGSMPGRQTKIPPCVAWSKKKKNAMRMMMAAKNGSRSTIRRNVQGLDTWRLAGMW